ncbi:OLC1v1031662C1 [Oldenlandia corymbosa var. corymbosa]|uniref:OLC1v1031662C1 n=1 Tax=Oldenlandia corymbosa var. corymbosa TaxID=529605 RepID=A0AAV1CM69_OLDCO|nr:OLC1v1031662C1 [Oldenlandia corymbosa var. corymbosa]
MRSIHFNPSSSKVVYKIIMTNMTLILLLREVLIQVMLRHLWMRNEYSQELHGVERKILLANQLPEDAISFSTKLAGVEKKENGNIRVKLQDGSKLLAKVVVACDGIRSPVAKWMGFTAPKYAGYCAVRVVGLFPREPTI